MLKSNTQLNTPILITGAAGFIGANLVKKLLESVDGVQIVGLQIPNWDRAIARLKEAHKRVPQCTLYGWDIAITEDDIDIVEANSKPGIRNIQQLDGVPKGHKLIPLLKQDPLKGKREEYFNEWSERFLEVSNPTSTKV